MNGHSPAAAEPAVLRKERRKSVSWDRAVLEEEGATGVNGPGGGPSESPVLAEREEGFIDYSKAGRKQSTEIKSPPPSSPAPTPASPPPAPSPPPNARPSPPPNHSPAPAPSHPTPHSPRKLRRKSLSAPPSPVSPPAPALSKPKPSPPPPSLNLKRAPSKPKSLKSTLGRQPAVERGIAVGPPLEGLSWAEEGVAVDGEEEHDSAKVQTHEQKVDLTLSAEDRHYLHRILVNLEIQRETSLLSHIGCLTSYGEPFLSQPVGPNSKPRVGSAEAGGARGVWSYFAGGGKKEEVREGWEEYEWNLQELGESPVLRYLYWRFILHLPVLRLAPNSYWTDHIQPFWDSLAEKDLSTTVERDEVTKRRLLALGFTRLLSTYFGTCLPPCLAPGEGVGVSRPSVRDMRRIDHLVPGTMEALWRTERPREGVRGYRAWVAVVREEEGQGEEDKSFLVLSRVLGGEDGDGDPTYLVRRSWTSVRQLDAALRRVDPGHELGMPRLPPSPTRAALQQYLRRLVISLSTSLSPDAVYLLPHAREKLEAFLLGAPTVQPPPSREELQRMVEHAEEEEEADEERGRRWRSAGRRARELRSAWAGWKGALVEGNELDKTMKVVRKTASLEALPKEYRDAQVWARVWVAYALHYLFVSSSHATEILNILKSFHDILPYSAMKLGLSLVNPTLAIRAIVQLFLGQPLGQPSLFQRIFSIICHGGIRAQQKLVDSLCTKVDNVSLCGALERHVYASFVQRQATRTAAEENRDDIIVAIVRDHGSAYELKMVKQWQAAFARAQASSTATSDASVERFINLKELLAAYCRKRDREQVLALVMEPNTPRLLHASIAVFYDTIYKVANASNLAARLGDLQSFLDDLIATAKGARREPSDFIKLAARHEQSLYTIVHELASNGGALLDPLIEWCRSGLAFIHEGIPSTSPSSSSKRAGVDYDALLASLSSAEAQQNVLAEARNLARWTRYQKAFADVSLRCDLLGAEAGSSEGDGEASLAVLDREAMMDELLEMDWELEGGLRDGKQGSGHLRWAWWAGADVEGVAGGERRKVEKLERESVEERWREKEAREKKLQRVQSRASAARAEDRKPAEDAEVRLQVSARDRVPEPSVEATRGLLDVFLEAVRGSLQAAREAGVK